jgi:hypothetical protein
MDAITIFDRYGLPLLIIALVAIFIKRAGTANYRSILRSCRQRVVMRRCLRTAMA